MIPAASPDDSLRNTRVPLRISRHWMTALALVIGAALLMLTRSPGLGLAFFGADLIIIAVVILVCRELQKNPPYAKWLLAATVVGLIGVLAFSRFSRLQVLIFGSAITRNAEWIGLSYLILRLIHVVIDSNKHGANTALKHASFTEMTAYALFPPALIAGPIHRANQFLPQLASVPRRLTRAEVTYNIERIGTGFVKKFIIADFLRLFALDAKAVDTPHLSPLGLWLSLLAFAFMIYFDFAGYSDMAIGVAGLLGIRLPENFTNPYSQSDLTRFWQNWHITLSTWLRDYIFVPQSRFLLKHLGQKFTTPIMLVSHLTTMMLAGLWHAFTPTFVLWGLWHGVGLFIHAQWSRSVQRRNWSRMPHFIGIAVTFFFVTLGWVFFALPDISTAILCFRRLLGR